MLLMTLLTCVVDIDVVDVVDVGDAVDVLDDGDIGVNVYVDVCVGFGVIVVVHVGDVDVADPDVYVDDYVDDGVGVS